MQQIVNAKNVLANLRTGGRWKVLVATALGWGLSLGGRMIYPVLLPHIRVAYELDLTTAGFLLTVLFLLYGLGQFPSGMLADRFGERAILVLSMLLSALTLSLVVTAVSVSILFAATALFGFSVALYAIGRYTLLTTVYPNNVGAANGIASAASDAGQSLLPPLAGVITALITWQVGLGFVIPLFLLSSVILWFVIPQRSTDSSTMETGLSIEIIFYISSQLRSRAVVLGTASLLIGVCIWQAFTGFYPTYLIEEKGLSSTYASIVFGTFFALGVLVQPISGSIYDQVGIRKSLTVVMGIATFALATLPLINGFWPLIVITVFVSSLLGFGAVTQSYLVISLPEDIQGTGFGFLRSISFTLSSISPLLFGAAADRGFFDEGFIMLAALAGGMVLLAQLFPSD